MGGNAREKSLRGNRKARNSAKHHHQHSGNKQQQQQHRPPGDPNPNAAPDSNPTIAAASASSSDAYSGVRCPGDAASAADLGYCTEEQLEDLLLAKLDMLYKDALAKLSALGYDDDVALRAVLSNGHCYGSMDALSNIVHNAISYINSTPPDLDSADQSAAADCPDGVCGFSDLRQLQECALTGMVCLLQELQPHLSRGDAMWCLLMNELHVGRASATDIPVMPPPAIAGSSGMPTPPGGGIDSGEFGCSMPYGVYRFHGGCGGERDGDVQKQFNRSFSKREAAISSSGLCPNSNLSLPAQQPEMPTPRLPMGVEGRGSLNFNRLNHEEEAGGKNSDVVASVLRSMENMSLEEKEHDGGDDPRNEMILNLIGQIRDLEDQVKERKEWAQQKALQAARKLSNDMMELKLLRMERDDNQRLKKGKQTTEDTSAKRLTDMENALRKASGQVDRVNAVVRQLEAENAELRAEMEASKLSNAESERMCMEIAKREKKNLKKLVAREKQKEKMAEEAMEVRKKIAEVQQKLHDVSEQRKATEARLKEMVKAKEQAIVLVDEERRAKEAAEESIKRKHEALRQKNEIDLQRQKDDIQRLEEELSRLKSSSISSQPPNTPSNILPLASALGTRIPNGANGKTAIGSQKALEMPQKKVGRDRECLMCRKDEVTVVLLPCAHQVLCASCSEKYENKKTSCPCCMTAVEQIVRVYGVSS